MRPSPPSRRDFLRTAGSALALSQAGQLRALAIEAEHTLRIARCSIQVSKKRIITTTAYNGQVPGPLLRLREGRPTTIRVVNETSDPEIVHWHGLHLPVTVDGAMEEGSPMIDPGAETLMSFTPKPAGFRWYHTHTFAGNDLKKAQYGGQHGFLYVDPDQDPEAYDKEVFLGLHDWEGHLFSSDDGSMNPLYDVSTINGRVLGFGEPVRVKRGDRVLFHILNSSPTETHWLALAGHELQVVALDGNPVPSPKTAPMLRLAPAERVSVLVDMNHPGSWIFGEVRRHVQAAGMGIVVEYAGTGGASQWLQPTALSWDYDWFAAGRDASLEPAKQQAREIPIVIEARFKGHGSMERWLMNGRSYPGTSAPPLQEGRRYRLNFINRSMDEHPMHLHRHTFELASSGIRKDVVLVPAQSSVAVEFIADNPGNTLLHCHQQNHMDLGFMMVLRYA